MKTCLCFQLYLLSYTLGKQDYSNKMFANSDKNLKKEA